MKTITVKWLPGRWDGVTLPPLGVFIRHGFEADKGLASHERGHWLQYEEWGLLSFYWRHAVEFWQYGFDKFWDNAPLEADATERGKVEPNG
jgi:hypothetical protein